MSLAPNIYESLASIEAKVDALAVQLAPPKPPPAVLAVPSYIHASNSRWPFLLAQKPGIVVINPGSGPGLTISQSYVAQVANMKAAGAKVLGYVHTKYGQRPLAEVQADIATHRSWYGVDGIFIDTTSADPALAPYYATLYVAIKAWNGVVVLNPGQKTAEVYVHLADHLMVSETYFSTYKAQTRPAWEAKYPASKFWHCIHTCPLADMPEAVRLAKQRNAGLIHVTDDLMPNPYDTVPAYLPALVTELAR